MRTSSLWWMLWARLVCEFWESTILFHGDSPVTWQLGLVEREVGELLRGVRAQQARRVANSNSRPKSRLMTPAGVEKEQREITADDVCPICQEEFLTKRDPVTYCKYVCFYWRCSSCTFFDAILHAIGRSLWISCLAIMFASVWYARWKADEELSTFTANRYGCGNNVHIHCMKHLADHQMKEGGEEIKCPMCRGKFGDLTHINRWVSSLLWYAPTIAWGNLIFSVRVTPKLMCL